MSDFYSAFSCGSCCALANSDKLQIVLCCEGRQSCCKNGFGRPKGCKKGGCGCKKKKRKH